MHGKRLGHEPGAGGAIEVPARETGDRPALQEDLERFAMLGGGFEPLREDDFPGRDRVKQWQQARRRGVCRQAEISGRDIKPGRMPTLLIPGDRR